MDYPKNNFGPGEDLNHYNDLIHEQKQILDTWIKTSFEASRKEYDGGSSYPLKHHFSRECGFYISNAQFKAAMLEAGFPPLDPEKQNWHFKMTEKIPDGFYKWCVAKYAKRDSPQGDFARDVKTAHDFPKASTDKVEIRDYMRRKNACKEALAAFEKIWKRYEECI